MRDLSTLTVVTLKSMLRARGLPVSGKKAVLIERLLSAPNNPLRTPAATGPAAAATRATPAAVAMPASTEMSAFPREGTPRVQVGEDVPLLRVASWNVAGLRGLLKREAGLSSLRQLVDVEQVDVLMLQETKLLHHSGLGGQGGRARDDRRQPHEEES